MPRAHIVLAHPEPKSFNGHLAEVTRQTLSARGWEVSTSDLCSQGFDPDEAGRHYASRKDTQRFDSQTEQRHASNMGTIPGDVAREIACLEAADLLVLQYPMWWFGPPAILKGWMDRVFLYGRVYTSKIRYDQGHFKGRKALVSVTCGGPEATFAHNGRNGDIDLLLWPVQFSLHYVGYTVLEPAVIFGVEAALPYSPRSEVLERLKAGEARLVETLNAIDTGPTVPFNGWADWDEQGRLKPGVRGHSAFMREET